MNQSQQFLLQSKRKKILGIEKKAKWKRPKDTCAEFDKMKPLTQITLSSSKLVY